MVMPTLEGYRVVDCTHIIKEGHPTWPGRTPFCRTVVAKFEADGYAKENWALGCDCCTHVDAPAHFAAGGRTIEQLTVEELSCRPAVVVDVVDKCEADNDYQLSVADLQTWEVKHGRIPDGALVCMRCGWDVRFGSIADFRNYEKGVAPMQGTGTAPIPSGMHTPGFSIESAKWLLEERRIAGLGTDTLCIDPGNTTTFAVHYYVLGKDLYMIENLVLRQLPESGALLVVLPLKVEGAPEAPARVIAFVPNNKPPS